MSGRPKYLTAEEIEDLMFQSGEESDPCDSENNSDSDENLQDVSNLLSELSEDESESDEEEQVADLAEVDPLFISKDGIVWSAAPSRWWPNTSMQYHKFAARCDWVRQSTCLRHERCIHALLYAGD